MTEAPREIGDELYAAPPREFVTRRNEAAKAAGDPATAAAIRDLRKPTVGAWVVNLLALRHPDLIGELTAVASSMRDAQRGLRGAQLRELSGRRRQVIASLAARARELATEADPGAAKLPMDEVAATLEAATADATTAEAVRTGRLVRASAYTGFGAPLPVGPDDNTVDAGAEVARPARKAKPARKSAPDPARVRALAEAREAEKTARHDLATATKALTVAASHLTRAEAALADLAERLAGARDEVGRDREAHDAARTAHEAAEQAVADAHQLRRDAEADLDP